MPCIYWNLVPTGIKNTSMFFFVVVFQKTIYGANVVIFEGILAFTNRELLKVSCSLHNNLNI